ncbi:pleckstrin homology domain-containing family A member 4 isoform X1 [Gopherus evgoodei]|uniref:pleckstrin homology domain-containing family A member 4 isoform X1 n=1 Tax=Gopherus evgoodei TaxID=1825980 RepID=UPI0011CEED66|nr:pleckstrin homology domain-containing family A member 4 isoform X1 [Gopherus evgoodei]XP_030400617.1 pleckstrin homology domain-containing family A member 4 isoform X1 [Gopherus evgoodei]XP_030400618.1 pleckstrin homology domain-containing family A member 4 isoform X1 [Gopherus evgoodei]XP_030400619.1 pleckstrin homology domain-containing family A member 4 isoform X1 [Gopherus evgoodei]XP_030400621.1 pleckstrin homology domain-containing family A member 4 isoform X1 [Gopherus evgoodei]XP_03
MADGERPRSSLSQASSVLTISSISLGAAKPSRSLRRVHTFGKRENSIKRDPNAPVVIRGWLCKQDSSGLKLWKRRWFVLADYCLFYYRDSREEAVLGSIPLPSYEIRPLPGDGKSRRFTFKAEHRGMRTYHFSADTQEDMNGWIRAMSQSAVAESDPSTIRSRPPQLLSRPVPPPARLFEEIQLLTPDLGPAKSIESLEIARLSGPHSSAESLSVTGRGVQGEGGRLPSGPVPPPSPVNGEGLGGELQGLSSLSSRILRGQETSAATRPHPGPPRPSPPPCPPEFEQPLLEPPSPWEPSADAQSHVRSSRSYSLPPTPAELRGVRGGQGCAGASSMRVRAPELAASCEELPLLVQAGSSLARPHTPVGRVDIAPGGAARGSRTLPGHPQTPADRYDVWPSEEPCARPPGRYPHSPHPSHCLAPPGTPAEESLPQTAMLGPALGRQPRSRFTDRVYPSLGAAPSRARLHGRLISPHLASSGYLHLPPLPPVTSRPLGKRTSLGAPPRTVAPLSRDRTLLALPRAESDTDILLTKLCGQDKLLRGLEEETGQLRAEKERLEKALELLRHQLDKCQGQELAEEKIWYQQRRLQDELVQVRARLCDLGLDSDRAWGDFAALEYELLTLRETLAQIRLLGHPQEQGAAQQELWMIDDITAGLGASPAPYPPPDPRTSPGFSLAASPILERGGGSARSHLPLLGPDGGGQDHEPPLRTVPAGGREEDRATRGDAWVSQPPQSPSRMGAGSPELDGGRPLQETDVAASGLSSPPVAPQQPQSPSPGPQEPREQRTEELPAKAITMDPPGPHRARMSVQEQLERMRRHQEGQRQQEGGRPNPWGSRQGSLRASASRLPLPTHPPDLGPEPTQTHTEPPLKGGQSGGPWGRSPPPLERDRHRVITLAYALATEASERSRLITGKNPPEPQLRANPDPPPEPLDAVTNQHVLVTPTLPRGHPEANHVEAEPCGPANRNTAFSSNSVQRAAAANQVSSVAELSNWFSPSPEAANHSAHLSEAANPASLLSKGSHWAPPLHTLANQTSTSHKLSNRASPLLWAAQKECGDWAAEQRIVGNKGMANGRCQGQGGRAVPRQVVAYLGEGSQPIRITLLQSSF